jgi:hypothetical protein
VVHVDEQRCLHTAQAGLGPDSPTSEAAVAGGQGAEAFMSEPESSPLTSEGDASELESLRNFSQARMWPAQRFRCSLATGYTVQRHVSAEVPPPDSG